MADYQYGIGTTVGNMENVEDLVGVAPVSVFLPFTERWVAATGQVFGAGPVQFTWTFDYISWAGMKALITKIAGSDSWSFEASHYIYVKTRDNFGDYHTFRAFCAFPEELAREFKGYTEFVLGFTQAMLVS